MKKITSAIDRIVMRIAGKHALEEYRAYKSWNAIVGDVIAKVAVPLRVQNGIIYVSVKNSTWRQELLMQKPLILKKYAAEFGPGLIQDIRLK
ncbi:MAG: DUF721 domain-containing protein [Candidatus Neomarinimicrobiota bacterium]|jgi:predicted nucleic acid-binding Zn ribbon protein|nr:DUF721 domain-containing protein [Candidatus Neomarinimicrobiota bacterium]MDD3966169.1 DUF721 domain-containing protein [Candidatus Neomarinimicrobiota bacterium]